MPNPASDPAGLLAGNQAIGAIYHLYTGHNNNNRSFITSLPLEILIMVFAHCAMDLDGSVDLRSLQLVCRAWKVIIDNTSSLWKDIKIQLIDNEQVGDIKSSLQNRLSNRCPNGPLNIWVFLCGRGAHENCDCVDYCEFQVGLCKDLCKLLQILAGPKGRHMARWTSLIIEVMDWGYPSGGIRDGDCLDFGDIFSYPAPLLERVELWALNVKNQMFQHAPKLATVHLMDCWLQTGITVSHVRELWIDHVSSGIVWPQCSMLEVLTIRIPREEALGPMAEPFSLPRLRVLRLLGHVSNKILEAVEECRLEKLVLRVNSPADLQRVIKSQLRINEIPEIVLCGFHVMTYEEGLNRRIFGPEGRKAALKAFVQRNGNRLNNVTLLGNRIDEELELAGFEVTETAHWGEERNLELVGGLDDWSEEGNDWLGPPGIVDEPYFAAADED